MSGVTRPVACAVAAAVVVAGLVTGCAAHTRRPAASVAPAGNVDRGLSALPGLSGDCRAMAALIQDTGQALRVNTPTQFRQASYEASRTAAAMGDPQFRTGAARLSQFDRQEAEFTRDPDNAQVPDSDLINHANAVLTPCVKK